MYSSLNYVCYWYSLSMAGSIGMPKDFDWGEGVAHEIYRHVWTRRYDYRQAVVVMQTFTDTLNYRWILQKVRGGGWGGWHK